MQGRQKQPAEDTTMMRRQGMFVRGAFAEDIRKHL